MATAPNQVWSWDITYLATNVKGVFCFLYLIMDVFSRKIVGWEIYASESAEQASSVLHKAYLREGVAAKDLVLHSDNGAPMKGATMLATLQRLGVVPSFSRPSVSDDNPYSEALFKTLKYCPQFPTKPFESLEEARQWVQSFVALVQRAASAQCPEVRHPGTTTPWRGPGDPVRYAAQLRPPPESNILSVGVD